MVRRARPERAAFTLMEVIFAMGLAALLLGYVLRSVALQTVSVSRATDRYQAVLLATQTLEQRMEEKVSGDESGDRKDLAGETSGEDQEEREEFTFTVDTRVVTADPRVEQVEVRVKTLGNFTASLSAYRLRIRRAAKKKNNEEESSSDEASPTPSEGGNP